MKIWKRLGIVCLVIATFTISCFSACKKNEEKNSTDSSSNTQTVATTNTYLSKNGYTSYQIVLPDKTTSNLNFAAEELQYFFNLATGANLSVISETQVENTKGRYLSIGATKIAEESGADYSYETVGAHGVCVKTYGDALVMVGGNDYGSLYAVYEYLKLQFNLEIYAEEVFTYKKAQVVKLIDVDYTDTPDIPIRSGGTFLAHSTMATYKARQRYRMLSWGESWGLWGHTHFAIMPPEQYAEEHPDWYNHDQNQLAWENKEMWDVFAENLKSHILKADPEASYFMLGQEDNFSEGYYDKTKYDEMKAKYGGEASGVELAFLNYVVQKVNVWLAEELPNRHIKFYMFAYQQTETSPAVWNSQKNAYEVPHEDLICPDNLGVQIAPIIQKDSAHGYTETNPTTGTGASPDNKRAFESWSAICKTLTVWGYSTSFRDGLHPFNGFYTFQQNYTMYEDIGVEYVFEQGAVSWIVGNFMELRQYLISKLMWDTTLDTETLIVNFFKAYYRDGWENMYKYFHLIHDRQLEIQLSDYNGGEGYFVTTNSNLSVIYKDEIMTPECFPFGLLQQCEKEVALAIEKANAVGDTDAAYAMVVDRLPLRYILLSVYKNYFEPAEYVAMVRDFERVSAEIGMVATDEVAWFPISDIIDRWLAD